MKIPLGFMLGFVSGAYVWSQLTEEQRAAVVGKIDEFATTGRTGKIASTVRRGVGDVADVATDRIADATESASETAAAALAGDASPSETAHAN